MKVISLLIITLSTLDVIQNCNPGCFSCESPTTKKCSFCDFSNFFVLQPDGTCLQNVPKNCTQILVQGTCSRCMSGYFLDNNNECLIIPDNIIPDCKHYQRLNGINQCLHCSSGTVLVNNLCVQDTDPIDGCESRKDDYCQECKSNRHLSLDSKSCVVIPSIANCFNYSFFGCEECKPGFVLQKNLYLLKNQLKSELINKLIVDNQNHFLNICQKLEENCLEVDIFGKCVECGYDFYLNAKGQCIKNPLTAIDFCQDYGEKETCLKCTTNFYLRNNQCLEGPSNFQDKCQDLILNEGSQTVECELCLPDFVLENQECVDRVKVEDCEIDTPNKNDCDKCDGSKIKIFITSQNKFKCIIGPDHCSSVKVNADGEIEYCDQCVDDFFVTENDKKVCELSPQESNCKVYNKQRQCIECRFSYKLIGSNCIPRELVPHCSQYDKSSDNCLKCDPDYFRFQIRETCKPLIVNETLRMLQQQHPQQNYLNKATSNEGRQLLENTQLNLIAGRRLIGEIGLCATYLNNDTQGICTSCEGNAKLDQTGRVCTQEITTGLDKNDSCQKILTIEQNGELTATPKCLQCVNGVAVRDVDDGGCEITQNPPNCRVKLAAGLSDCYICQDNFVNSDTDQCIAIGNFYNCRKLNIGGLTCSECLPGFHKDLLGLSCSQSVKFCQTYDFQDCQNCHGGRIVHNNECIIQIPNCDIYHPGGTSCQTCANNNIPSVSGDECLDNTTSLVGCLFAQNSPNNSKCAQCDTANNYIIQNVTEVCQQLVLSTCILLRNAEIKCEECEANLTPSIDGLKCLSDNLQVTNCKYADNTSGTTVTACNVCQTGYEKHQINCLEPIPNCSQRSSNSTNTCENCNVGSGYIQTLDQTQCLFNTILDCITLQNDSRLCEICGNQKIPSINGDKCISSTVNNCRFIDITGTICLECKTSFFPTESKDGCFNTVTNCNEYRDDDNTKCAKCSGNHLPEYDNGDCKDASTAPSDCQYLDANSKTLCRQCKPLYIVSEDKLKCVLASIAVTNCLVLNSGDNAICEICDSAFISTDDKSKCLDRYQPEYVNCLKASNDATDQLHKCETCENEYIKRAVVFDCIYRGTIQEDMFENCVTADQNAVYQVDDYPITEMSTNKCADCTNQVDFIKTQDGRCINKNDIDPNCKTPSFNFKYNYNTLTKFCFQCDTPFIISENDIDCHTGIDNCKIANNDGITCYQCSTGFYLIQNGSCVVIDSPITNCTIYSRITILSGPFCHECSRGNILAHDYKSCITDTLGYFNNCLLAHAQGDATELNAHCYLCEPNFYISMNYNDVSNPKRRLVCSQADNLHPDCIRSQGLNDLPYEFDLTTVSSYTNTVVLALCGYCNNTQAVRIDMTTCNSIPRCEIDNEDPILCDECQQDYILIENQTKCILNTNYQNCILAMNDATETNFRCHTCDRDYSLLITRKAGLDEYTCVDNASINSLNQVDNCLINLRDFSKLAQSNLTDAQYSGTNLTVFANDDDQKVLCEECQPTFLIFGYQFGCIPSSNFENCQVLSSNGTFCDSCQTGYKLTSDKLLCISLNQDVTRNCLTLANDGLTCTDCTDSNYEKVENDQGCVLKTETFAINCNIIDESGDFCKVCDTDHVITQDGSSCEPNQTGPFSNCLMLNNSKDKCLNCENNFELVIDQTTCFDTTGILQHCETVSWDTTNFFCETCKEDNGNLIYILYDGKEQCYQIDKTTDNYEGCTALKKPVSGIDPECTACEGEIGLLNTPADSNKWFIIGDKNKCFQLNQKPLAGCLSLASDGLTCNTCSTNYVQRQDKTECLSRSAKPYFQFCEIASNDQNPNCDTCLSDYLTRHDNNDCLDKTIYPALNCQETEGTNPVKCKTCSDPSDIQDGTSGNCYKNNQDPVLKCLNQALDFSDPNKALCITCENTHTKVQGGLRCQQTSQLSVGLQNCIDLVWVDNDGGFIYTDCNTCQTTPVYQATQTNKMCLLKSEFPANGCDTINDQGDGCLECTVGYVFNKDTKHCLISSLNSAMKDCEIAYNTDQEPLCQRCKSNYMKTPSGDFCVEETQIIAKNCKVLSQDGLQCDECLDDYFDPVNQVNELYFMIYLQNNGLKAYCKKTEINHCEVGYKIRSEIPLEFQQVDKPLCKVCEHGFEFLIDAPNLTIESKYRCVSKYCESEEPAENGDCKDCTPNTETDAFVLVENKLFCNKFTIENNLIGWENCDLQKEDQREICQECNANFANVNGVCQAATLPLCLVIENEFQDQDYQVCNTCEDSQTFDNQLKACKIENCEEQKEEELTCYKCFDSHQLTENRYHCVDKNIIQFCEIYQNDKVNCYKCEKDHKIFEDNGNSVCSDDSVQIPGCQEYVLELGGVIELNSGVEINESYDYEITLQPQIQCKRCNIGRVQGQVQDKKNHTCEILNCETPSNLQWDKCVQCQNRTNGNLVNYIPTINNEICIQEELVPDCKFVDNDSVNCLICETDFAIVFKNNKWVCEKNTIQRCQTVIRSYSDRTVDTFQDLQQCFACEFGYVNTKEGNQDTCLVIDCNISKDNGERCRQCLPDDPGNNTYYKLNKNEKMCVKMVIDVDNFTALNWTNNDHLFFCEIISVSGNNCEKCDNNSYPMVQNSDSSLQGCIPEIQPSQIISYCTEYELYNNVTTDPVCRICNNFFELDDDLNCIASQCETHINLFECSECEEKYHKANLNDVDITQVCYPDDIFINCLTISNDRTFCEECKSTHAYINSGEQVCQTPPINQKCQEYRKTRHQQDFFICDSCLDNTFRSVEVSTGLCKVSNCKLYNEHLDCLDCVKDHLLTKIRNCIHEDDYPSNCIQIDDRNLPASCVLCDEGYGLSQQTQSIIQNECVENDGNQISHCLQLDPANLGVNVTCKTCEDNYHASANKELCIINNCDEMDQTIENLILIHNTCNVCSQNPLFLLSPNKKYCFQEGLQGRNTKCALINNDGYCVRCHSNFAMQRVDTNNYPECVEEDIDNCQDFQIENNSKNYQRCLECETYYHLNIQSDHQYCIKDNCILEEKICSQCNNGFIETNPLSNLDPKTRCVFKDEGCKTYNYTGDCNQCEVGFGMLVIANKVLCIAVVNDENIRKCQEYENQNNQNPFLQCKTCADGFTEPVTDKRYCKPLNCDKFESGICQLCQTTHLLLSNQIDNYPICISRSIHPFCQQLADKDNCERCLDGHAMFKDSTDNNKLKCKSQTDTNNVLFNCQTPHIDNGLDNIIATPICKTCHENFELHDVNNLCNLKNCGTFGQQFQNGTTHKCDQCAQEHSFTLTKQYCVLNNILKQENCATFYDDFTKKNQCAVCQEQDDINNDVKYAHIQKSPDKFECVYHNIFGCETYQISGNLKSYPICTKCEKDYYHVTDTGSRTQCDLDNCEVMVNCQGNQCQPFERVCQECDDEYRPTENFRKCVSKQKYLNCKTIDDDSEICKECDSDFGRRKVQIGSTEHYLCLQGEITQCEEYVQTHDAADNSVQHNGFQLLCKKCFGNYELKNNGLLCELPHCGVHTSGVCTECENQQMSEDSQTDSYRFNKNHSLCVLKQAFKKCKTIDVSGKNCEECHPRYGIFINQDQEDGSDIRCAQQPIPRCQSHYLVSTSSGFTLRNQPQCISCDTYYEKLENDTVCKLQNCKTSDVETQTCSVCNDDSQFTENKIQCIPKVQFPNCKVINDAGNDCLECIDNFGIYFSIVKSNHQCQQNNINNCIKIITDKNENPTGTTIICKICDQNHDLKGQDTICELVEITNCDLLENQKCTNCKDGYIKNSNDTLCVEAQGDFSFCNIASLDGLQCYSCLTSHAMVNTGNKAFCQENQINQCKEPQFETNTNSAQRCITCNPEHYLIENKSACVKGDISHCKIMSANISNKCDQCEDQYFKIRIDGDYDLCIPASDFITCQNPQFTSYSSLVGFNVNCNYCQAGEQQTISNRQVCSNTQIIPNCISYILSNNVTCLECEPDYYLLQNENRCQSRTNVDNCEIFDKNDDKCLTCIDTYHTVNLGKICQPNPLGKSNCISYDTTGENCIACGPFTYLEGVNCKPTTLIDNCQFYDEINRCNICSDNFQRLELSITVEGVTLANQCRLKRLSDKCIIEDFTDEINASCTQCKPQYKRQQLENGTFDCVDSPDNCILYDNDICIDCDTNFYLDNLDNSTCKAVSQISSCTKYSGINTCVKCNENFTLNPEQDACVSEIAQNDPLCFNFKQFSNLQCQACNVGYIFNKQGECISYSTYGDGLEGCVLINVNETQKCSVCGFGYYMDENYKCLKIPEEIIIITFAKNIKIFMFLIVLPFW